MLRVPSRLPRIVVVLFAQMMRLISKGWCERQDRVRPPHSPSPPYSVKRGHEALLIEGLASLPHRVHGAPQPMGQDRKRLALAMFGREPKGRGHVLPFDILSSTALIRRIMVA